MDVPRPPERPYDAPHGCGFGGSVMGKRLIADQGAGRLQVVGA